MPSLKLEEPHSRLFAAIDPIVVTINGQQGLIEKEPTNNRAKSIRVYQYLCTSTTLMDVWVKKEITGVKSRWTKSRGKITGAIITGLFV